MKIFGALLHLVCLGIMLYFSCVSNYQIATYWGVLALVNKPDWSAK